MQIEVCFPTLNRPAQAAALIDSIGGACPLRVSYETEPHALTTIVNRLFLASYAAWADVSVMLADHLQVLPGWRYAVERAFLEHFPDMDGVVGLNIANMKPQKGVREFCFVAVGRRFLERFPFCMAFCPDYYHFMGDTELGEYATKIERFYFASDACVVTSLHDRDMAKAMKDSTHRASRMHVPFDEAMRKERQKRGLVWGKSFGRINDTDPETAAKAWKGAK